MAIVAGVDGCKAGWLCITKDVSSGFIDSAIYLEAKTLLSQFPQPDLFGIDIPIGLISSGPRLCDVHARKILAKRKSSVFPAPIREILDITIYSQASLVHKQITTKGISRQTFAICGKICEIDQILAERQGLQERVKEIHPEVCFWAWNGKRPMQHNKKTKEGADERRKLIIEHFGAEALEAVRKRHRHAHAADDDIHDAFAALWTAERIKNGTAERLPEQPPCDDKGLCMEMWF